MIGLIKLKVHLLRQQEPHMLKLIIYTSYLNELFQLTMFLQFNLQLKLL